MNEVPEIKCPKCSSTQITANKKGFSGKKAVGGALLTGGIGLLAGTIGSNQIIITCLNCGNKFKPGDKIKGTNPETPIPQKKEEVSTGGCVVFIIATIAILIFVFKSC